MSKAEDVLRALAGDVGIGTATTIPSLPTVPTTGDATLDQFLSALKQTIETWSGTRGDALDSTVTWRDLIDKQFATVDLASGVATPNAPITVRPATIQDLTPPPAPQHLTASGALATIILTWDEPTYGNHAYTEIWRSGVNNIGTATRVGMSPGTVYSDAVGSGQVYYYWVRFVTTSDVTGPYNSTNGTRGETSLDPGYLMDVLTSTYGESPFFSIPTPTVIDGVTIPAGVYIKQAFIYNGSITNAKIANAAIDTAKISDAAITTAKIADAQITTAKIGDAQITNAKITNAAIDNAKIADAAITTAKIADAQITSAKIGSAEVNNANIADAAITTAKINNAAITTAKIADGQITNAKIANASIDAAKIVDASITNAKIANASIDAAKIVDASITTAKIADAQITTAKIGTAQIDTLRVAGNAITVAAGASGGQPSVTISTSGGPVFITVTANRFFELRRNGAFLASSYYVSVDSGGAVGMISMVDYPGVGTFTYLVYGPASIIKEVNGSIFVLECKR